MSVAQSTMGKTSVAVFIALLALAPISPAAGQSSLPTLPGASNAPAAQQPPTRTAPQTAPAPAVQPVAQPVAPSAFDAIIERRVAEVYPPAQIESPQHVLADPVKPGPSQSGLGLWNQTSVQSRYGNLEVANESLARIRIREAEAITKLKAIDTGETVTGGMANAAMAPIRAVGSFITSPVETVKNIPKGVGEFVSRTSEGFKSDKSKFEDGMFKEISGVTRKKRELAAQMGVDVYSSNQLLQSELDRIGTASAGGNITVDVGMIAISGAAGAVISNLGRVDALQEIVNTQPASELRRRARYTLEQMAVPKDLVDKFLDHPYWSPRRKTIVAGLLSPMRDTKGRENFVQACLAVDSEEGALYYQQMLEIISSFNFNVSPVTEIVLVNDIPAALSAKGAFLGLPVDRMYWTQDAAQLTDKLLTSLPKPTPAVTMWVMGDITPLAAYEMSRRNVVLGQKVQLNYN